MFQFCLLWAYHTQPGSPSISHRQWVSGPIEVSIKDAPDCHRAIFYAVTVVYTKFEVTPFSLPLPVLYGSAFWGKLGLMGATGIFFSTPFLVELHSSGSCTQRCRRNPISTRNFVSLCLRAKIKEFIIGRLTVIAKGWHITASLYLRLNPYFSKVTKIGFLAVWKIMFTESQNHWLGKDLQYNEV